MTRAYNEESQLLPNDLALLETLLPFTPTLSIGSEVQGVENTFQAAFGFDTTTGRMHKNHVIFL